MIDHMFRLHKNPYRLIRISAPNYKRLRKSRSSAIYETTAIKRIKRIYFAYVFFLRTTVFKIKKTGSHEHARKY